MVRYAPFLAIGVIVIGAAVFAYIWTHYVNGSIVKRYVYVPPYSIISPTPNFGPFYSWPGGAFKKWKEEEGMADTIKANRVAAAAQDGGGDIGDGDEGKGDGNEKKKDDGLVKESEVAGQEAV